MKDVDMAVSLIESMTESNVVDLMEALRASLEGARDQEIACA